MLWGLFVRPSDGKIVEGSRLEAKGGVLGVWTVFGLFKPLEHSSVFLKQSSVSFFLQSRKSALFFFFEYMADVCFLVECKLWIGLRGLSGPPTRWWLTLLTIPSSLRPTISSLSWPMNLDMRGKYNIPASWYLDEPDDQVDLIYHTSSLAEGFIWSGFPWAPSSTGFAYSLLPLVKKLFK